MEKTNKPVIAGVLAIIAGILAVIFAIIMFIAFSAMRGGLDIPMGYIPNYVPGLVLSWAIPTLIFAILAGVGGVFALMRKTWGLALAGSIAAIIAFFPTGIPAVILVAISRREFE